MGSKRAGSGAEKSWDTFSPSRTLQHLDAIDREYLGRFTLGNAALEQEVLELFVGQIPVYMEQLQSAETAKAWADAVHTVKGSARAIGARRLAAIAEIAEQLDLESRQDASDGQRMQAIEALEAALDHVRRAVARLYPAA